MEDDTLNAEFAKALKVLKKGGTLLYPTDTVWGVGCDATNKNAVERVCALKRRGKGKSFIVLVDSIEMLRNYVVDFPEYAVDIIQTVLSPLTIIYPKGKFLASNVYAQDGSIAIRVVRQGFCKELIQLFQKPIVSSSANLSSAATPKNFQEISPLIKEGVDYVVKTPDNVLGEIKTSRIIKLGEDGIFTVIRE